MMITKNDIHNAMAVCNANVAITVLGTAKFYVEVNGITAFFREDEESCNEAIAKLKGYLPPAEFVIKPVLRTATVEDFKVGTVLIDTEGNEFGLRRHYAEGIWECNGRVHFENEAKFYKVELYRDFVN